MSRLFPVNFHGEKYGLSYRLVKEEDAEYIFKLRSDAELSKYISSVHGGVSAQVEWIRNYKKREEEGTDYYFIFLKDEEPVGLYRLYNIHGDVFTTGSWVFDRKAPAECAIIAVIIINELAFEELGMKLNDGYDAAHVDNKSVVRFNRMLGMKEYGRVMLEKGEYIQFRLTKEDFEKNKIKILKYIG